MTLRDDLRQVLHDHVEPLLEDLLKRFEVASPAPPLPEVGADPSTEVKPPEVTTPSEPPVTEETSEPVGESTTEETSEPSEPVHNPTAEVPPPSGAVVQAEGGGPTNEEPEAQ
jgi:hypothetical protein